MYREAREELGISREEAAFRLHVGTRTLAYYEVEERMPAPDTVLRMCQIYNKPELTIKYCRECPIGEVYGYEVLNNIDMSLPAVLLKLRLELNEAVKAIDVLQELVINKQNKADFTEEEWDEFILAVLEFFDVEHNIKIMKIALEGLTEEVDLIPSLIKEHNRKCLERGYVRKEKAPELVGAR